MLEWGFWGVGGLCGHHLHGGDKKICPINITEYSEKWLSLAIGMNNCLTRSSPPLDTSVVCTNGKQLGQLSETSLSKQDRQFQALRCGVLSGLRQICLFPVHCVAGVALGAGRAVPTGDGAVEGCGWQRAAEARAMWEVFEHLLQLGFFL